MAAGIAISPKWKIEAASTASAAADARLVNNLVIMGMGEPLQNYSALIPALRTMLDDHGLKCRATTPHIYMREYVKGAFTNPDATKRHQVRARVEEAIDAAHAGARYQFPTL